MMELVIWIYATVNGQLRDDQWDDLMDYEQDKIEALISIAATVCIQVMHQGMKAGLSGNISFSDGPENECAYLAPDEIDGNEEYFLARLAALRIHRVISFPSFLSAVHIPEVTIPEVSIIKGDAKSISIGAASILAKVTRDHYMEEMDAKYPEYHFRENKGYGTKDHIDALRKYGPCPIHRRSFITHFI